MKKLILLIALAGCEPCEQRFRDGQIVTHRLLGDRFIVLRSSEIKNIDGLCLVDVATPRGIATAVVDELEALPPPPKGNGR